MQSRNDPLSIWRVALLMGALCSQTVNAAAVEPLTFEHDVRPILKTYCLDCHGGGEKLSGNLDLRLARFARTGGDGGPAVVAGNPASSLLVQRLKSGEMPPTEKKVPAEKISVIEQWIAAGAVTTRHEPEQLPPGIDITPAERAFWFFQPIKRREPPLLASTVSSTAQLAQQPGADVVRTPVDAFVLARLREKGLHFAPE
ncbi:MAG TPA: c-type cytochrome domain-containing protein, partial [Planctomycetaceae bacterium]